MASDQQYDTLEDGDEKADTPYCVRIRALNKNDVSLVTNSKNKDLLRYMQQWYLAQTDGKEKEITTKTSDKGLTQMLFDGARKSKKFGASGWSIYFIDAMIQHKYSLQTHAKTAETETFYFTPIWRKE